MDFRFNFNRLCCYQYYTYYTDSARDKTKTM